MDGNGRWAHQRGKPRLEGHRASLQSVRDIVEACRQLGIGFLTLYTFSAENWTRPPAEVAALMMLIRESLASQIAELDQKNVRVRHLGQREGLPDPLLEEVDRAAARTANNAGLTLHLAINYGGRQEIIAAARALAEEVASGRLVPGAIDEQQFAKHLYRPELPDPDLLIRTGGDFRVSNYLLWEIAYTEIYVTPTLWPDFGKRDLYEALASYQGRQRRFGGVEDES